MSTIFPATRQQVAAFMARDANQDGYLSGREIPAEWADKAYKAADGRQVVSLDRLSLGPTAGPQPNGPRPQLPPVPGPTPPTPQPQPVQPVTPVAKPPANDLGAQVLALCNAERVKHGLKPFTSQPGLDAVAQAHSQDMIDRRFFSHNNPSGQSPFQRMKAAGVPYGRAAENIAYGQRTPEEVVRTWMNSPGHRANLMNPGLTRLGVGAAKAANGQIYWTQAFSDGGGR